MADSQAVKAFEQTMAPLPEGVVSQDNPLTPTDWTPATGTGMTWRMSDEGKALTPFTMVDNKQAPLGDRLEEGSHMYDVYCTPCHGDGQTLGVVAGKGTFKGLVPKLSGSDGRLKDRTDAEVYLTILSGFGMMPAFDWGVSSDEAWAITQYVRTMPNGKYIAPEPVAPEPEEESP